MWTASVLGMAKCQAVNSLGAVAQAAIAVTGTYQLARPGVGGAAWGDHEDAAAMAACGCAVGYPVEAVSGRFGGYEFAPGGAPPRCCHDEEAVAVALAGGAAAGGGLPGFEDAAWRRLARSTRCCRATGTSRSRKQPPCDSAQALLGPPGERLDTSLLVTSPKRPEVPSGASRSATSTPASNTTGAACRAFRSSRRWATLRTWWLDRDRCVANSPTGQRCRPHRDAVRPPDPPDAAEFVAEGLAVSGIGPWQARHVPDVTVEEVRRIVAPTIGVIEQSDAATVLRTGADDLDWIARYLALLPCRFRVIEPDDLRQSVTRLATQLATSG